MKKEIIVIVHCFLCLFSAQGFAEEKSIVVVIPSYNNSLWIERNVASILKQKYENFRVVYVNDCSIDTTQQDVQKIVELYLEQGRGFITEETEDPLIEDDKRYAIAPLKKASNWFRIAIEDSEEENYAKNRTFKELAFSDGDIQDITESSEQFSQLFSENKAFFTLINNVERRGALCNLYRVIHSCADADIIVTVDGDDWLAHDAVLSDLNELYSSQDVWLTHGTMIEFPDGQNVWSKAISSQTVEDNAFRESRCPSHLRTFYAGLFKKIVLKDLLYGGSFFPMTWDMAMMFPMIEMAGERHGFIKKVSYVYNKSNSINDNKVNPRFQNVLDALIRHKERYNRIDSINEL